MEGNLCFVFFIVVLSLSKHPRIATSILIGSFEFVTVDAQSKTPRGCPEHVLYHEREDVLQFVHNPTNILITFKYWLGYRIR